MKHEPPSLPPSLLIAQHYLKDTLGICTSFSRSKEKIFKWIYGPVRAPGMTMSTALLPSAFYFEGHSYKIPLMQCVMRMVFVKISCWLVTYWIIQLQMHGLLFQHYIPSLSWSASGSRVCWSLSHLTRRRGAGFSLDRSPYHHRDNHSLSNLPNCPINLTACCGLWGQSCDHYTSTLLILCFLVFFFTLIFLWGGL